MTKTKIILSKIAHGKRLQSFRRSAVLIFTSLVLLVAAATQVATAQTYTDLYNFRVMEGRNPGGILAQGRDGNLYGTTAGPKGNEVFKITTDGNFKGPYYLNNSGFGANTGLTLGTDGDFYGTTEYGGNGNACKLFCGTIFRITSAGRPTTLHNFAGATDGW